MNNGFSDFAARLRRLLASEDQARQTFDLGLPTPGSTHPSPIQRLPGLRLREDAVFNELALELFALQFEGNPAYRRICEARGLLPSAVRHWSRIPAVPTAGFKELELSCLPHEARTVVFHSSGTSDRHPSRHFHNRESLAVYEASLWPWFRAHLLRDLKFEISNLRFALLTPPPSQAPHSSLVHMFETVRRQFGAANSVYVGGTARDNAWTVDFGKALTALRAAADGGRPMVLLGTAFSFVHLLDYLADQNTRFNLPPGSRAMETGGYKGRSRSLPRAELHSLITQQLGIPGTRIVCEYGMSELSSQAYDAVVAGVEREAGGSDGTFHFPPWARAQLVSPETGREAAEGETGLIRVFDLANVFSVMAIQTEDLAVRHGDGFELIGRSPLVEPRGCSLMSSAVIQ